MPGQKKVCNVCGEELPIDAFYKKKHGKYGVRAICIECDLTKCKDYYHQNIKKLRARKNAITNRIYIGMNEEERKFYLQNKALHNWVRYHKEKQKYCCICNEVKNVELSNISGEYNRDIKDFWWLCHDCHGLFDRINKTHKVVA